MECLCREAPDEGRRLHAAQVGLKHQGVAADIRRLAAGNASAAVQYRHLVGHLHHQFHVVLHQQHGVAGASLSADVHRDLGGLFRVQSGHRFVQQHQSGIAHEGAGHLDPFLLAVGQRRCRPVRPVSQSEIVQGVQGAQAKLPFLVTQARQAQHGDDKGSLGRHRQPGQHIVQHRQPAEQLQVLKGARNAQGGNVMGRQGFHGSLSQQDGAGLGAVHPADAVDQRRFTGTVGSDERRYPSRGDVKRNILQGRQAAEPLTDLFQFKHDNSVPRWKSCRFARRPSGNGRLRFGPRPQRFRNRRRSSATSRIAKT